MVILTLAVCIGANTAVFSIVSSVLLDPLPLPASEELVLMGNRYPRVGAGEVLWSAGGDYVDRQRAVTALQHQALFQSISRNLEAENGAERLPGMVVTPSLFQTLQVAPQYGRAFDASEGELGNEKKILLSHSLWQRLYGGDFGAVGSDLQINGEPYAVVGVMPHDFLFYDPEVSFWIPLALTPAQKQAYHSNNWFNIGRLKPGASVEQVQAQVNALNAANLERYPEMREIVLNAGFETKVLRLKDHLVRDVADSLHLLHGGALLVLLIGALNAAGLVVARTSARAKEIGIRLALGASPGRIAGQMIAENLLLSTIGGLLGLAMAGILVYSLGALGLGEFPRSNEVEIGALSALFTIAVSVLAGMTIAAINIGHVLQMSLSQSLGESSRSATGSRRAGVVRRGLVASQVGLAFLLVTGAALMLASFQKLARVEPGYEIEGVLTVSTAVPRSRYAGQSELIGLTNRSLDAIRAIPGVRSAGITSSAPLSGRFIDSVVLAEGYFLQPGESVISPIYLNVTPGYFDAMQIDLLQGRDFNALDSRDSLSVVVIDEGLAERFWPGQDPLGRRLYQPTLPNLSVVDENTRWWTVVGVVESVRMKNLAGTDNEAGAYYVPFSQFHPRNFTFTIKTDSAPESLVADVRKTMAGLDPSLALFDVRTMEQRAAASLASRRAILTLLVGFSGISLILASVGLYGVLSYLLAQRRRDIAIRMAVGCTPGGIFRLFLVEGAMLVGIGIVGGLASAVLGQQTLEGFLYGVSPLEPLVLALVTLLLGTIAFLAIVGPAWGAARVAPSVALDEQ